MSSPEIRVKGRVLSLEPPEEYQSTTYPKAIKKSKQWVLDIFSGKREHDRILYQDEDLVLIPNIDWNNGSLGGLHVMAIYKRPDLLSIRDLKSSDVEMLRRTYHLSRDLIVQRYGLPANQIKAYFHYPPSVWQLHLHFINVNDKEHCAVERSHNVEYVIQHLELIPDYYQRITLQVKKTHRIPKENSDGASTDPLVKS